MTHAQRSRGKQEEGVREEEGRGGSSKQSGEGPQAPVGHKLNEIVGERFASQVYAPHPLFEHLHPTADKQLT